MLCEYGKRTRDFFEEFFLMFSLLFFGSVFNKTIIPLAVVGYEMIIANSAVGASLAIHHHFSNSLIIHQAKTKEITTMKEVLIPGLN